jgi:polar amino acid transport system substrate-binding protein
LLKYILLTIVILFNTQAYGASLPLGIHEFPPFVSNTLRQNGLLGFFVKHVFSKSGVDVKMSSYTRGRLFNEIINEGKTFGVFPALKQDSFAQHAFSDPILIAQYVFIHRKGLDIDGVNFQTLEGLEKYRIGVLISSGVFQDVKDLSNLKLTKELSAKQLVLKLSNRNVDMIIFEKTSWNYISKDNNVQSLDDYVKKDGPWSPFPVYVMISKKYPEYEKYLKILNEGLAKYDLNKIINDHFY